LDRKKFFKIISFRLLANLLAKMKKAGSQTLDSLFKQLKFNAPPAGLEPATL